MQSSGDASAAATACDDVHETVGDPVYPCAIAAIVIPKCGHCHRPRDMSCDTSCVRGPFSLLRWQDMHAEHGGVEVWELSIAAIERGTMPLRSNALDPPAEPLTSDEQRVLLDWLEACVPPDDGASCPPP